MRARTLLLTLGAVLLLAAPAAAKVEVDTIATGLDNPRHLALWGDKLYVAEAGSGGPGPCFPGPEGGAACVGDTGAVTVVTKHGQHRIVDGLASLGGEGTGAGAIGPHGVFISRRGELLITNGGPTALDRDAVAAENPVADLFGRVLRIKRNGAVARLVDVWDFERDNNPDAEQGNPEIDSNAVDVLADGRRLIVADAGGNSLLKARRNGDVEALSIFPNRDVEFGGETIPMQAVPTGVVKGPRGDYFMTQLTGFPFPPGGANVFRVDRRSGNFEVFAGGFTNLMDLAFDRHGTLWVLEIDHDSLFGPVGPGTDGAIFAIDRRGTSRQLQLPAGTLTHPGGITVGRNGTLYVSNHSDEADTGEVLRIRTKHHGHRRHHGHRHDGYGGGRRHDDD
jgi:hypothetical protein